MAALGCDPLCLHGFEAHVEQGVGAALFVEVGAAVGRKAQVLVEPYGMRVLLVDDGGCAVGNRADRALLLVDAGRGWLLAADVCRRRLVAWLPARIRKQPDVPQDYASRRT